MIMPGARSGGVIGILLCFLTGLSLATAFPASAERLVVIANGSGPFTSLTMTEVRDLYLGERQFVGTERARLLHLAEGPVKEDFVRHVVGMTLKEYKLHWVRRVFQEGTGLPVVMPGSDAVITEVAAQPSSLGYIPESAIPQSPNVHVLFLVPEP